MLHFLKRPITSHADQKNELRNYDPVRISPALAGEGALPTMVEKLEVFSPDWLRNADKLDLIVEAKPHFCSAICASFSLFASDGSAVAQVENVWGKLLSSKAQPIHELLWQISPSPLPEHINVSDEPMIAFISEESPITQLLEKNRLPSLTRNRIYGPDAKHLPCSVSLADVHGPCTIIWEWTTALEAKDLEQVTRQSLVRVDSSLRQAVRRFREVVPWSGVMANPVAGAVC